MPDETIAQKSRAFAIRIVRLYKHLSTKKQEYVLSRQLLRAGTSIGANAREAMYGHSRKEFICKMAVALKEAVETEYWLDILHATSYLSQKEFDSIMPDCQDICRMLTKIVKNSKEKD